MTFGTQTVLSRFAAGHKYLRILRTPGQPSWRGRYELYRAGDLDLEFSMTLAHPIWLPSGIDRRPIHGDRGFGPAVGSRCNAERLWGYRCDIADGTPQGDHVFPWTLGGPTVAANRITLCGTHNGLKGADVHLYPWEEGEPAWLAPLLERYSEFIA